MKVPPLCTVAVRATAQAPRPRLPRKKPFTNEPLETTFWASVPNQTDAAMKITSAIIVPMPGLGDAAVSASKGRRKSAIAVLPDDLLHRLFRINPQILIPHENLRDNRGNHHARHPRHHQAPENPVRKSQHERQIRRGPVVPV